MRRLAITCGDPAGVGPEVIEAWLNNPENCADEVCVIGPHRWLSSLDETVNKLAVGPLDYSAKMGEPDAVGAKLAWAAMEEAASGCVDGRFRAVVTGPVSKFQLAEVGYPFPGQTEFFAAKWGGDAVMAFRSDHLRVSLATWHIPLHEVAEALTEEVLERAVLAAVRLAQSDGVEMPRVAVCGLNPHAGEGGLLGTEERELLDPILDKVRGQVPNLSRCLPGDTVFGRSIRGEFDAVVALYHDQGLAPLKTIDFDNAVNVTLGLPFVRTSPDHGTGFDIAGQGVANSTSFDRAVALANRLTRPLQT